MSAGTIIAMGTRMFLLSSADPPMMRSINAIIVITFTSLFMAVSLTPLFLLVVICLYHFFPLDNYIVWIVIAHHFAEHFYKHFSCCEGVVAVFAHLFEYVR